MGCFKTKAMCTIYLIFSMIRYKINCWHRIQLQLSQADTWKCQSLWTIVNHEFSFFNNSYPRVTFYKMTLSCSRSSSLCVMWNMFTFVSMHLHTSKHNWIRYSNNARIILKKEPMISIWYDRNSFFKPKIKIWWLIS